MKQGIGFYWLIGCLLLMSATRVFAAEPAAELKTATEIQISAEDRQVIALMELLEKMEMLKDLAMMTDGEVKQ